MPKPIEFELQNAIYGAKQDEYQQLPAHRSKTKEGHVTTCWEFTPEELAEIAKTGKLWMVNLTYGRPLLPVMMFTVCPLEVVPDGVPATAVEGKNIVRITRPGFSDIDIEMPARELAWCDNPNRALKLYHGAHTIHITRADAQSPFFVRNATTNPTAENEQDTTDEYRESLVTILPVTVTAEASNETPATEEPEADFAPVKFSEWLAQLKTLAGESEDVEVDAPDAVGATEESRNYWFEEFYTKGHNPQYALKNGFRNGKEELTNG